MIIFLHGPDTFRSGRTLAELKQKFIREIDRAGINLEIIEGGTADFSAIERAVLTPPFLVKKRMVIIKNLFGAAKKNLLEQLEEFLKKNDSDDIIIVLWDGEVDAAKSKNALFAFAAKQPFSKAYPLLKPREVTAWAAKEVTSRGGDSSNQALEALCAETGNDLWRLNAEIEKLIAYAKGRRIEEADVKLLVSETLDDDIYRLTDALGKRDKKNALRLINRQLRNGTEPIMLLGKMVWQFRTLVLIGSFLEKNGPGYPSPRIAAQLKLHPYVVQKSIAQVRAFPMHELKTTYGRLLDIDREFKSAATDPETLFSLLVAKQ